MKMKKMKKNVQRKQNAMSCSVNKKDFNFQVASYQKSRVVTSSFEKKTNLSERLTAFERL